MRVAVQELQVTKSTENVPDFSFQPSPATDDLKQSLVSETKSMQASIAARRETIVANQKISNQEWEDPIDVTPQVNAALNSSQVLTKRFRAFDVTAENSSDYDASLGDYEKEIMVLYKDLLTNQSLQEQTLQKIHAHIFTSISELPSSPDALSAVSEGIDALTTSDASTGPLFRGFNSEDGEKVQTRLTTHLLNAETQKADMARVFRDLHTWTEFSATNAAEIESLRRVTDHFSEDESTNIERVGRIQSSIKHLGAISEYAESVQSGINQTKTIYGQVRERLAVTSQSLKDTEDGVHIAVRAATFANLASKIPGGADTELTVSLSRVSDTVRTALLTPHRPMIWQPLTEVSVSAPSPMSRRMSLVDSEWSIRATPGVSVSGIQFTKSPTQQQPSSPTLPNVTLPETTRPESEDKEGPGKHGEMDKKELISNFETAIEKAREMRKESDVTHQTLATRYTAAQRLYNSIKTPAIERRMAESGRKFLEFQNDEYRATADTIGLMRTIHRLKGESTQDDDNKFAELSSWAEKLAADIEVHNKTHGEDFKVNRPVPAATLRGSIEPYENILQDFSPSDTLTERSEPLTARARLEASDRDGQILEAETRRIEEDYNARLRAAARRSNRERILLGATRQLGNVTEPRASTTDVTRSTRRAVRLPGGDVSVTPAGEQSRPTLEVTAPVRTQPKSSDVRTRTTLGVTPPVRTQPKSSEVRTRPTSGVSTPVRTQPKTTALGLTKRRIPPIVSTAMARDEAAATSKTLMPFLKTRFAQVDWSNVQDVDNLLKHSSDLEIPFQTRQGIRQHRRSQKASN